MADTIIKVEGIGKKFRIRHKQTERYTALRDVISEKIGGIFRPRKTAGSLPAVEEFWALKDVSFEVERGEIVGIIGRNGAGKSTLLKILSRITEPTEGRIELNGRVASLLEVGTGFHPELTGRENIYLNGAILGMSRNEIRRKFDEIVAFAEVEKFLDTPVKRYSSGMYVRLAFAVAAHMEPEILVIDEVLAVGDAEFQKKCLGKMGEVSRGGRTVLFVSHNMAAVQALCRTSIHLAGGRLVAKGETDQLVDDYLNHQRDQRRGKDRNSTNIQDGLVLERLSVTPCTIRSGDASTITCVFAAENPGVIREYALFVHTLKGLRVAIIDLRETASVPLEYSRGRFEIETRIASLPLVEGAYTVGLYLATGAISGNYADLEDLIVSAPLTVGFAPYPAEVRGMFVLRSSTSIKLGTPQVVH